MERSAVFGTGYTMNLVRMDEDRVRVRLSKHWLWTGLKYRPGRKVITEFEIATTGMQEHDILRAALSDAMIFAEGGPWA